MRYNFAFSALLLLPLLGGCGSDTAATPTLLAQQNVNGTYSITATGNATDPVLFNGAFASQHPLSNSGASYYSSVAATLTPGVANDAGSCNGQTLQMSGKVTNPTVNDVDIDMSGNAPGGGTVTLTGSVLHDVQGDLGSRIEGTLQISGGSCAMAATAVVALRQ